MTATPRVIRAREAGAGELHDGRGTIRRYVDPGVGARQIDLHVNTLRVRAGPGPYHYHSASENAYYVVAGIVRVRVAREEHELGPGDAAFIPPGIPHSVANAGDTDAVLVEVYSPAEADFIAALDG